MCKYNSVKQKYVKKKSLKTMTSIWIILVLYKYEIKFNVRKMLLIFYYNFKKAQKKFLILWRQT